MSSLSYRRGFAPIVIALIVAAAIFIGVSAYVLVKKPAAQFSPNPIEHSTNSGTAGASSTNLFATSSNIGETSQYKYFLCVNDEPSQPCNQNNVNVRAGSPFIKFWAVPTDSHMKVTEQTVPIIFTLRKPDGSEISRTQALNYSDVSECAFPPPGLPSTCVVIWVAGGPINFADKVIDEQGGYFLSASDPGVKSISFAVNKHFKTVIPALYPWIVANPNGFSLTAVNDIPLAAYEGNRESTSTIVATYEDNDSRLLSIRSIISLEAINGFCRGNTFPIIDHAGQRVHFYDSGTANEDVTWLSGNYCVEMAITNPHISNATVDEFLQEYFAKYPSTL